MSHLELVHAAKVAIDKVANDESESEETRIASLEALQEVIDEHQDEIDEHQDELEERYAP